MTALVIQVRQAYATGFLEVGALATVRLLADLDGKPAGEWWQQEVPIPIGGQGRDLAVTVQVPQPGHYQIAVTFPRGDDLVRQVRVAEGEQLAVPIDLAVSPHEYLAWQQFSGSVRARPYERESERAPVGILAGRSGDLLEVGQAQLRRLYAETRPLPTVSVATVASGKAGWAQVGAVDASADPALAGGPPAELSNRRYDDEFAAWFDAPSRSDGVALLGGLRGEAIPPPLEARYSRWLAVGTEGTTDLVSVPWAWWGALRDDDEEIQFFYDRVRPSPAEPDVPGRLRLSVRDQRWFALLEYLGSGRIHHAVQMLQPALQPEYPDDMFGMPEAALFGKTKGPLVATAGAIALIADATSEQPQYWDPWLDNLANWFPGIPDGAILLGCRRADQARDHAQLQLAFDDIREGIDRGIPYFAATMRMASLALARMGGDVDGTDAALRTIAGVSSRVDPDQPFTVIRLR
jgi:hypothetical protein